MTYLLAGCQIILTLILLMAAIGKLLYPEQLIRALWASNLPKATVKPLAIMIVVVEFTLSILLIFSVPWSLLLSFTGAFVLLGGFTGWLTWIYYQKIPTQCGCFGKSSSNVEVSNIFRNLVFMGISALGFFLTMHTTSSLPTPSLWTQIAGFVIVLSITLFMMQRLRGTRRDKESVLLSPIKSATSSSVN